MENIWSITFDPLKKSVLEKLVYALRYIEGRSNVLTFVHNEHDSYLCIGRSDQRCKVQIFSEKLQKFHSVNMDRSFSFSLTSFICALSSCVKASSSCKISLLVDNDSYSIQVIKFVNDGSEVVNDAEERKYPLVFSEGRALPEQLPTVYVRFSDVSKMMNKLKLYHPADCERGMKGKAPIQFSESDVFLTINPKSRDGAYRNQRAEEFNYKCVGGVKNQNFSWEMDVYVFMKIVAGFDGFPIYIGPVGKIFVDLLGLVRVTVDVTPTANYYSSGSEEEYREQCPRSPRDESDLDGITDHEHEDDDDDDQYEVYTDIPDEDS